MNCSRCEELQKLLDAVRAERDEARAALADKAMLLERYAALLQQNVGLGKDRDAIRAERDKLIEEWAKRVAIDLVAAGEAEYGVEKK